MRHWLYVTARGKHLRWGYAASSRGEHEVSHVLKMRCACWTWSVLTALCDVLSADVLDVSTSRRAKVLALGTCWGWVLLGLVGAQ